MKSRHEFLAVLGTHPKAYHHAKSRVNQLSAAMGERCLWGSLTSKSSLKFRCGHALRHVAAHQEVLQGSLHHYNADTYWIFLDMSYTYVCKYVCC